MFGPLAVPVQLAELARLEALGRTRALTDAESATLENLIYREQQRAYRAHASRNRQPGWNVWGNDIDRYTPKAEP